MYNGVYMWMLFLIFHLVGLVGYNLLLRKSLTEKADRLTLAVVMQTGIALPLVFVGLFKPPDRAIYDTTAILHVLIISSMIPLLHIANVLALQHLEASVYSILYNLRILFTTVLGIVFLNEAVVPLQILGGMLIFLAVVTVRQKGRHDLTHRGIEWGIAASVIISILNLFEKELIDQVGYLGYAIPCMILAAVIMWALLFVRGKRIPLRTFKEPAILQLMVLRALSAFGFGLAFSVGGLLSVSTYISSLSVIIIVMLGVLLLGERDYMKQKIAATTLAVLGLTVIFIANLN